MPDDVPPSGRRCPECDARNPADAAWCSQCFARFAETASVAAAERHTVARPAAEEHRSPAEGGGGSPTGPGRAPIADGPDGQPTVDADLGAEAPEPEVGWTCRRCGRRNAVSAERCADCDLPIVEAVVDREETAPPDVRTVLRASLLPGGGIAVTGEPLLGWAVGAATAMSFAFAVLLAAAGSPTPAVVLVVIGLAIWVVAAFDGVKRATGRGEDAWLRPRVVSIIAGAIVFIAILAVAQVTETGR